MQQSNQITLASRAYEVEDFAAAQELYHSSGWTDGLPVVPPTESAVTACLDWALMPPDQLIGIEPVREQPITAEKLAINAVMAGCLPVHFPVVATAWQAMLKEEFLLHGVTSSTGGSAVLVIINGPIRHEIGANSTFNALANSDRATAAIGRALRLSLINLLDVRPGGIDRTTLGHPGKFSYCLAEDEEDTTWQPLAAVRGIPEGLSAVTVMAALAPRQIMNEWSTEPREILETFAAEMRANQRHYSIYAGNYVIVIPKQLREPIQAAGWTKRDIAEFLYERARAPQRMGRCRQGCGGARPWRDHSHGIRIPRSSVGCGCRWPCGRLRRSHSALVREQNQGRYRRHRRLRRLRTRLK